jgi:putative transposase
MITKHNPTDRGKSGVKRSLLTEGHGVPIGLEVDGANRHDLKLVHATLASLVVPRPAPTPQQPQGLCLDAGYDYDEVYVVLQEFGFTAHVRSRGEEARALKQEAGFRARRWVVERAHSWINRFRRLLVRWDKNPENYLAFLHFAWGLRKAIGLLSGRRLALTLVYAPAVRRIAEQVIWLLRVPATRTYIARCRAKALNGLPS